MYQEIDYHNPGRPEAADRDILAEYDDRIAAAERELEQAQDEIRNKLYPTDAKERAVAYRQRLMAIDNKQAAITRLTYERIEAEERLAQERSH